MRIMSRMPLLLALVLAVLGAGVQQQVTPTRATSTHAVPALPAAAPNLTPQQVIVTVQVSPNPANVASPTTISVTTVPNALCQVQVLLPGGGFETSPNLVSQGAGPSGSVSWTYLPSGAALGLDNAVVTCTLNPFGTFGQGNAQFLVLPTAPTPTPTGSPIATTIPGVPVAVIVGPNPIQPGGVFSIQGAGFTPTSVVSFTAFSNPTTYSATVGASGGFTIANIMVPYTQVPGPVVLNLHDNAVIPDHVNLTIIVAPIAPVLNLNTGSAAPGDPVQVTGSGYGANEVVDVALGPIVLLSVKTDNNGTFSGSFQAPATVGFGTFNVAGTGEQTGALAFKGLLVTPNSPFAATATATGTPTSTATPLPPTATGTITPVPIGPIAANYYFAEGTTAQGNIENISILNPVPVPANAFLNLVFEDGVVKAGQYLVPANGLSVVNVNGLVGNEAGKALSLQVSADEPVSAARSLVRPGKDGTLSNGTAAITHYAYFAEGFTARGFHETLAIFNPVNANANVTLRLLPSNGRQPIVKAFVVGPIRRYTVDINKLAPNQSVGAEVISDVELSVERTLTFGKNGAGQTTVPGVDAPQSTWYFAEGSTRNAFSEFITLLNPNPTAATVTARFLDASGKQIGQQSRVMRPNTRATINVGLYVSSNSIGTIVTATQPILAERTMYRGKLSGAPVLGTGSFGRAALASGYDFPSGDTTPGQAEFLLLFNPNNALVTIFVTFFPLSGPTVPYTVIVPPHARRTVNVARDVPNLPRGLHGATVRSSDGSQFMAEQSLYQANFTSGASSLGVAEAPPPVPGAPVAATAPVIAAVPTTAASTSSATPTVALSVTGAATVTTTPTAPH